MPTLIPDEVLNDTVKTIIDGFGVYGFEKFAEEDAWYGFKIENKSAPFIFWLGYDESLVEDDKLTWVVVPVEDENQFDAPTGEGNTVLELIEFIQNHYIEK